MNKFSVRFSDGTPAGNSFGASFFSESNEAGIGNTGFDSAFPGLINQAFSSLL